MLRDGVLAGEPLRVWSFLLLRRHVIEGRFVKSSITTTECIGGKVIGTLPPR